MPSSPSLYTEAGSEALRAIGIVAALIVTALFPGIFATYEQPKDLGFEELGYGRLSPEGSFRVRMYLRAGCASAVAIACGAIVAALAVQLAIAMRSVDAKSPISDRQLNAGYLVSLYLLLFSVANTQIVVGFGVYIFTGFPANVVLVSIIAAIGLITIILFVVYLALPAAQLFWLESGEVYKVSDEEDILKKKQMQPPARGKAQQFLHMNGHAHSPV